MLVIGCLLEQIGNTLRRPFADPWPVTIFLTTPRERYSKPSRPKSARTFQLFGNRGQIRDMPPQRTLEHPPIFSQDGLAPRLLGLISTVCSGQ